MRRFVTIFCAALIAASSIHAAAAAGHHHTREASRESVMVNDRYRNSNNQQPAIPMSAARAVSFLARANEKQGQASLSCASTRSLAPNRG